MDHSANERQFRHWADDHSALLHRIARAFAGPADQADLLQELLLTLWRAVPKYRGDCAERTFVYRVAHNRALTWAGREQGRRCRENETCQALLALPADGDDGEAALLERLYAAIRQLPPVDRSLILLALDGVPHRDAGAFHGLSETAVGARISRARARLVTMVETENDDGL
jgi:RNA polymerase sigma-70 factor (ECF subfamily)